MEKDFDTWNTRKKKIEHDIDNAKVFHEREIWWCSIGLNIGDEQDGKNELFERPVLIVRKFNKGLAWVLPLTSTPKQGIHYHSLLFDDRETSVILSQMRLVSSKRLLRYMRKISQGQTRKIRNKIARLLGADTQTEPLAGLLD
jgi:mRNA-degrading endonuclease toxin of MazEF toxin-antitoxin module